MPLPASSGSVAGFSVCSDPQKSFSKMFKRTVILLAGPTGSGKTAVSLKLAPLVDGEIISVDSMQVYQGMDIGTAKVSLAIRQAVPHHLIDICHVQETFNAVDFYYHAIQACQDILSRNKVPILVGGTGFYFHTFLSGPPSGPSPDFALREQLSLEAQERGIGALYQELVELDSAYAATITKHDKNKIIRALEIIRKTGNKVSSYSWESTVNESKEYHCRGWLLSPDPELLRHNILERCDQMLEEGLVDEVRSLVALGIKGNTSASRAIGYREWIEFLDAGSPVERFEDTKQKFITNTWRYTKKQRTWFKRYPLFRELSPMGMTLGDIARKIAQDYFLCG
ncbi:tRNA (adenosine(37)-N6)-dimethylallyltransferase MiaA [Chlamydia muridarum str. Nigg]|jgi:tRNA dimethylallyltransferase|nr:tRNA (adenosine(37)-N6)-dimethylallyltransferase MiaA [Chlamydia muridarum]AID37690.1 tRNA delta(2)-isopentenylpyrophosphate transferase [Chlamydia muridarum str. Nigg 2 MCR]AIT90375.1 tRNA delta(2)-isopentenylpyrophosphate transferase [Chlamydia muridarum]AIT91263.1 tRNA delta(2)-isopentenylpyrophosphate transferase [Chlamydia muridarum]AIW23138.1 tRNA delta(2)-isopentenylpyrophosphate transferase [Chlamydia muridarum]AJR10243.1 tRNA delta(2)-isopentenylpyrophosphate transferase [Chlamydia